VEKLITAKGSKPLGDAGNRLADTLILLLLCLCCLFLLQNCSRDPFKDDGYYLPPPYFAPLSRPFTEPFYLEIAHELEYDTGVTLWYTFEEDLPTNLFTRYVEPILIDTTTTVSAFAHLRHHVDSDIAFATYTLNKVGNPIFSLPDTVYYTPQTLQITTVSPEDTLYYTINGHEPIQHLSYLYTDEIELPLPYTHRMTFRAKAFRGDWIPSDTVIKTYEFKLPMMINVPGTIPGSIFKPTYIYSVHLSPFYIGNYPITQTEYQQIMVGNPNGTSENPSLLAQGDFHPVDNISWYDAIVYCNRRSVAEGLSPCYAKGGSSDPDTWGSVPAVNDDQWNAITMDMAQDGYRLPTEMEWMYAANGALENILFTYSGSPYVGKVAWYSANSDLTTHTVGTKDGNQLGLYDMSGNVWEWCWDWHSSAILSDIATNPTGPASPPEGNYRVMKGGSAIFDDTGCAISFSGRGNPHFRKNDHGFRVVRRNR